MGQTGWGVKDGFFEGSWPVRGREIGSSFWDDHEILLNSRRRWIVPNPHRPPPPPAVTINPDLIPSPPHFPIPSTPYSNAHDPSPPIYSHQQITQQPNNHPMKNHMTTAVDQSLTFHPTQQSYPHSRHCDVMDVILGRERCLNVGHIVPPVD